MRKKGVFFTFVAIFIIILIVAVISTKETFRHRERSEAVHVRVRTMNNFIDDLEKDLQREMFIGGYRALLSMNSYVREKGSYVTKFDTTYKEIFINGTANGTTLQLMQQQGIGADVNSWLVRVNAEAAKLNVEVNLEPNEVKVRHVTPWVVKVYMNATITVNDTKGLAAWRYTKGYSETFSILGLEDPLYIVETEDAVTNLVNITPDFDFVGPNNETDVLEEHVLNSFYVNNTVAPSYLMRFSGNLSASPYGIESMVNLEDLDAAPKGDEFIYARTLIDYLYFDNQTKTWTEYCNFSDMSDDVRPWFRIDDDEDHLEFYEIEDLKKTSC